MRVRFIRLLQKNINISLSVDRILIIYNTESSLTAVVSSCHAGVEHTRDFLVCKSYSSRRKL